MENENTFPMRLLKASFTFSFRAMEINHKGMTFLAL